MWCQNKHKPKAEIPTAAFTLIEVVAALAIVSIALLALLRLHIVSIGLAERAEATYQAALLAERKIEEVLAQGYPRTGTDSGAVQNNALELAWRTEVTDILLPELAQTGVGPLREISVQVSWKHNGARKNLHMSTCVADRKLK